MPENKDTLPKADTEENSNSDQSGVLETRRKAVTNIIAGGITAGSAVSFNWAKPVVNNVVIPAHAKTSTTTTTPCPPGYYYDFGSCYYNGEV